MPLRLTHMSFDLYYLRKITTIAASKLLCNDRQSALYVPAYVEVSEL